jgi:hypothetical protein
MQSLRRKKAPDGELIINMEAAAGREYGKDKK